MMLKMNNYDFKTFIIALALGLLLGVIGTCICKNKVKITLGKLLDNITTALQKLWYIVVLLISTVYVISKYPECTNFTFFSDFNGDNLVFILYLILLILPLFDKLELFGVNLGLRWQNKLSEEAAKAAINSQDILNKEELEILSSKEKGENNE